MVVGALHDSVAVPVGAATVTVVLWAVLPPVPVQLKVKVVVALMAPVT